MLIDPKISQCNGLELNVNPIAAIRSGPVTGRAAPIHVGKTTQVWDIRITSDADKLICVSRLTLAVTPRKQRTWCDREIIR